MNANGGRRAAAHQPAPRAADAALVRGFGLALPRCPAMTPAASGVTLRCSLPDGHVGGHERQAGPGWVIRWPRARRPFLCRLGLHAYPRFVNPLTHSPAPVRCERCRRPR